uniref:NADH-ubiquinone oxidoreductase chain 2 n=1 Tax=Vespula vulgaris TaxID=7454 RepID=A0A514LQU0_VESVU|nr:NADH dehydrogenase subunit 2 [Vespula vulgaris]QDI94121.1 NADH dehydrogenase subunit 2 [Vespula vulgaris]QDI94134.1 NADH dehydrogenase subunit 2 [Vespula vulgaris]QDI94147.1 NADH dehydrogenase subunit 2 [Vespula vulgaris]QDI94160.1 NADH dehydrogenase subunit 2 [Vespula vulgaris]
MSLFLSNFIHLWIIMEINTLFFISLMSMYTKNFKSTFNFFIIQSISSLMLIMLMMMKNNFCSNTIFNMSLILVFSLKLGLFPFFFWPPLINANLNWMLIFIMSTSQKLIPLLIFNTFFNQINNPSITYLIIGLTISSSLISTIMNYNETNFKKILTYSSTNHLSWMIFILMFDSSMFFLYFFIYFLSMIFLCVIFNKFNIDSFFDLLKFQFFNYKKINFILSLNFLIISALPPFLTFMIKINSMKIMIENCSLFSSLSLTLISIFTLIFYMNIVIKLNMMNMMKTKFFHSYNFNIKFNFFSSIIVSFLSLFFMFSLFYSIN